MQNTRKQKKENQKQLSVQSRVKRLIASRRLNLIKVVDFTNPFHRAVPCPPKNSFVSHRSFHVIFFGLLFSNDATIT